MMGAIIMLAQISPQIEAIEDGFTRNPVLINYPLINDIYYFQDKLYIFINLMSWLKSSNK